MKKIHRLSTIDKLKKALSDRLTPKERKGAEFMFGSSYQIPEVPKIMEKRGKDYILWGEDNEYPDKLVSLINGSAIHNAIIRTKAIMTAGDGFFYNGAQSRKENEDVLRSIGKNPKLAEFILNEADQDSIHTISNKIAQDIHSFGCLSLEVIWNPNHDKIIRVKHLPVKNVRAGKKVEGKITKYYYHHSWTKQTRQEEPIEYAPFNPESKEKEQIYFLKTGGLDYYGEPPYIGALTWIKTDYEMGVFHLANIQNGMNPSLAIKFYEKPGSDEDKQSILKAIRREYRGTTNTAKDMVFFSEGKELSPDVEPIQNSNLDKQYLALAELCDRKILTGHQLTSPLLVGISTTGQLSGNTELKTAFNIFDNVVIAGYRSIIERVWNDLGKVNVPEVTFGIDPYNPFKEKVTSDQTNPVTTALNSISPLVANKVLDNMTSDEIRSLIGLEPTTLLPPKQDGQ